MPLITDQLPVRLSPLVGRASELASISQLLTSSRLLTLTGPGGTGKTRLALTAVTTAATAACWVELAPIDDPGILPSTVAARLGAPDIPGQDPVEAITAHINDHQVLLVLDNCEHLTEAAAKLTERLLEACPALSILATSREPLGVEGERTWPVPPLARTDAVTLFEQRARLVNSAFQVTDDNAAIVRRICQRLDGLPLAIELSAARMRILSAAELAARLDDIFAVLVGGSRSAPPRHQTLRAMLDWSHDLLSTSERLVFRRLAAFNGGFTLEAAEQVTADHVDIMPNEILEVLSRLADKSLLRVDLEADTSRYYLLETIWGYARQRLRGTPDEDPVRQAHLSYYADFAEQAAARLETYPAELDRLDVELPNLRRAVEHAHASASPRHALRIAAALDRYAYVRGHYHEIRQWLDEAIAACPDAPAQLRAKALLGGGRLALLQCDYGPALDQGEAALRLYRELGDARGIASGLQVLGSVAREQGRYVRAVELHTESLAVADAAGDRWAEASAHGYLAFTSWLVRDFATAEAQANTALDMFRAIGDVAGVSWSLINLGTVARFSLSSERAVELLTESRTLSEGIGFREGVAWSLEQLGLLAAERGDPGAVTLLRQSLELHTQLRDRWRMSCLLEDLAATALDRSDPARAARLLGAAEAIREAVGTVIAPSEQPAHEAAVAGALAALGQQKFETAREQGLRATAEDLRADLPRAGARAADTSAMPVLVPAAATPAPAAEPVTASAEHMSGLRISALGRATVEIGGAALTAADWSYAKPRELLFLLVSSAPLTKEQIGAALWPDLARQQLGNALHTALRELRRALGDAGWVVYADGHYRFDRSREHECDVTAFEDALAAARRARPAGSALALADLQRAIAAYGGDFLDGMTTGEWALVRRDALRHAFESALLATGRLQAAAGRHQAAAVAFRRAVAHEPLNESAHRELMNCWVQLGETARAVRHYEELAGRLRDQLGVSPAAETTALYRKLIAAG